VSDSFELGSLIAFYSATITKGGLMYEVGVGGQKFSYKAR
jgi:hypothetical protein